MLLQLYEFYRPVRGVASIFGTLYRDTLEQQKSTTRPIHYLRILGTLNLASLPLRRRTTPLPALTRLSIPQQQPPWALRAASVNDNALEKLRRRGDSVAAYRLAAHPLGDRGGLCVAQHGLYNLEKPGLQSFLCAV